MHQPCQQFFCFAAIIFNCFYQLNIDIQSQLRIGGRGGVDWYLIVLGREKMSLYVKKIPVRKGPDGLAGSV
jgi:hypothetical protein